MPRKFSELLYQKIQSLEAKVINQISKRGLRDMADYSLCLGQIEAYRKSLEEIKGLYSELYGDGAAKPKPETKLY